MTRASTSSSAGMVSAGMVSASPPTSAASVVHPADMARQKEQWVVGVGAAPGPRPGASHTAYTVARSCRTLSYPYGTSRNCTAVSLVTTGVCLKTSYGSVPSCLCAFSVTITVVLVRQIHDLQI